MERNLHPWRTKASQAWDCTGPPARWTSCYENTVQGRFSSSGSFSLRIRLRSCSQSKLTAFSQSTWTLSNSTSFYTTYNRILPSDDRSVRLLHPPSAPSHASLKRFLQKTQKSRVPFVVLAPALTTKLKFRPRRLSPPSRLSIGNR